jgi:hypothetical protein
MLLFCFIRRSRQALPIERRGMPRRAGECAGGRGGTERCEPGARRCRRHPL